MAEMTDDILQRMSQFLTTEHFTLQGARNGTISESNGRLGGYLSAVSMSIVALAFVAQVSQLGSVFLSFSVIIFPILISLGIGTWIRLIQLGVTDVLLIQAINRIRNYYLQVTPEAEIFFSFPQFDDVDSIRSTVLPIQIGFEGVGSAGFQVSVINSVLIGAFIGILSYGVLHLSSNAAVLVGVTGALLGFGLQLAFSASIATKIAKRMEIRFPNQEEV